MALMPTMTPPRARTSLSIPGVTDVGPVITPSSAPKPPSPDEFRIMPVGEPVVTPTAPPVPPAPTTTVQPSAAGRSAQTTTLPQITIGGDTFTQGGQVPPGANGVGLFGIKINGKPQGAPSNPAARTIWRGPQGVWYAWRPNGPNGDGWYKLGAAGSSDQVEQKPIDESQPSAPPAATPPPAAAAPPAAAPSAFQFDPNWWWNQFTSSNQYQMQAPGIQAQENQIAARAGYQIRRDSTQGSPTYGQILYRTKGGAEGSGSIIARLEAVPGSVPPQARYVYRDASGREYQPADLEIDIVRFKTGDVGYGEGQFGQAEMASAVRMPELGVQAARAGAGRSGVRAAAATMETQALQRALANIARTAGEEFGATGQRWMDLINSLYPGLAESARELWEGSQTPPADGGGEAGGDGGGAAPGEPGAPAAPGPQPGPSIDVGGMTYGVGDQVNAGPDGVGMFSRKGTPGGDPPKNPKNRELFRGRGGVWWAWRPNGPNGSGWYQYVPAAPGAPSPTQSGVTTRPPASTTPAPPPPPPPTSSAPPSGPQFSFNGRTYSQGSQIPPGPNGIGKFTRKGSKPDGAPNNPPAGTLHRGRGGVWFVYRPTGPNGAGWYRQP